MLHHISILQQGYIKYILVAITLIQSSWYINDMLRHCFYVCCQVFSLIPRGWLDITGLIIYKSGYDPVFVSFITYNVGYKEWVLAAFKPEPQSKRMIYFFFNKCKLYLFHQTKYVGNEEDLVNIATFPMVYNPVARAHTF